MIIYDNNLDAAFSEGRLEISEDVQMFHFLIQEMKISSMTVVLCYCHPDFSRRSFLAKLKSTLEEIAGDVIVVGDFNINLITNDYGIKEFFNNLGLTNRLPFGEKTTNGGTAIDLCFSNAKIEASIHETYYSYHKGICINWE